MILTAMIARTARRASPLLGHPPPSDRARRVLPFGLLVFDFDMSAVVLDTGEICDDLDKAFSRGPYASAPGAALRPVVRTTPPSLAASPLA